MQLLAVIFAIQLFRSNKARLIRHDRGKISITLCMLATTWGEDFSGLCSKILVMTRVLGTFISPDLACCAFLFVAR